MRTLLLISILVFVSRVFAAGSGQHFIVGKVKSFDDKFVIVISGESIFKFPRERILLSDLKASQEIQVHVEDDEAEKFILAEEKKK